MTAAFYFDLASPHAYLAAERVLHVLPGPAEWQPVLARELPGGERSRPSARAGGGASARAIARRARELGLQPLRWPEPFPFDSTLAMRVATYAKSIGRAVPFAQAAFRQAFAGGRSLADEDYVLIAAAACEMHPAAVLRGARAALGRSTSSTSATAQARGERRDGGAGACSSRRRRAGRAGRVPRRARAGAGGGVHAQPRRASRSAQS